MKENENFTISLNEQRRSLVAIVNFQFCNMKTAEIETFLIIA